MKGWGPAKYDQIFVICLPCEECVLQELRVPYDDISPHVFNRIYRFYPLCVVSCSFGCRRSIELDNRMHF